MIALLTWSEEMLREDPIMAILLFAAILLMIALFGWLAMALDTSSFKSSPLFSYAQFFYSSFLKPHEKNRGDDNVGQQLALESFYATQASVYDTTRRRLLRGREELLGLVAAQLEHHKAQGQFDGRKPIWVDIGGGTGWNIEAMGALMNVPEAFEHVYLVDLSPSLCQIAKGRFQRLGWTNVSVVCEDARTFRLPQLGNFGEDGLSNIRSTADLVSFSYSLSMIPDYYSVIDSASALLDPKGIIAVVDFYVQSIVDVSARNYTGGAFHRHVNWIGRAFWRAWFDFDRVSLEGARRDFLEYRFGTIASASLRNYPLGGIPYYLFIGCNKESTLRPQHELEKLNAVLTESPYLSPKQYRDEENKQALQSAAILSKACEAAVVNLSANLPLPSTFYQNHKWRVYYNDLLQKHTQFKDEYIYAFNWEDPRTDRHILNINKDDVILTITSAGDNIMDYLLECPRRVHAVDLNPNQNHLLELKVAAFTALPHSDVWKLFAEGRHPQFRDLLVRKLSPHLSSQALQYWVEHASTFTWKYGLYETGGSRLAVRGIRYLMKAFGLSEDVNKFLAAETLNEQREIWPKIRSVLLSWPLHYLVVNTEWFAWRAFGVPAAQRWLIQHDFAEKTGQQKKVREGRARVTGEAMWEYAVNTVDPVAAQTLLSTDNYFYALCLKGSYTEKCHPRYLAPKSHVKLSRPDAFDGLRIHTDSINEVVARIAPETLTIAVIMDSMDWFPHPTAKDNKGLLAATMQVQALNRVLVTGKGRVLLRSAGLRPWYLDVFENTGFKCKCIGRRDKGKCIDRVNMYASTWLCTKSIDIGQAGEEAANRIQQGGSRPSSRSSSGSSSSLQTAPAEQQVDASTSQGEVAEKLRRFSTLEL